MNMHHPPIPPNHLFFRTGKNADLNDETWFLAPHKYMDTANSAGPSFEYIQMNDRLWREVIAAVSFMEWTTRYEDRFAGAAHKNAKKYEDGFSCDDCFYISQQWRNWGRGEKWK